MIYFSSDFHLNHKNIIKYCQRPFNTIEEMNETLINNFNSVVKPNDMCYFLGDMVFKYYDFEKFLSRLNGRKHLIKGNHDDKRVYKLTNIFDSISDIKEIRVEGQHIVLCHYAMRSWSRLHYGSWQLYGHSHGTLERNPDYPSFDVGVDAWNYFPVSFDRVKNYVKENYNG